ncbi:MAG: 3-deoxy-7-phosphoheptulonate synthase [Gammaproteobacteria bacterium]|jgi:3-deoxy-7-phosphoheptulonate synthase|nr:3-deoxy-7-phosphoheptulonate synthase [Gammaproteobacteria bacterium]
MPVQLENLNVESHEVLITPEQLKRRLPVPETVREQVNQHRDSVREIVEKTDKRLLVVVGPCSIHDPSSALEYAKRLKLLAEQLDDRLLLVMRSYFEKPRSTVGWKGLINDPFLDDSFKVNEGLHIARELLLDIAALGLPLATEALDPITPQYLQELFSWSAIGARTTESQTHREMASGLSCAVGFKNGTDGSLDVAINALQSVAQPHRFLGISTDGQVSVVHTRGNAFAHIVLRGGANGPNYDAANIDECERRLNSGGLNSSIMVDCSHANSNKDYRNQPVVLESVAKQIAGGNNAITGVMIESHLHSGNQSIGNGADLAYGVSITDACVGWAETETMLRGLHSQLSVRFR